MILKKCMLQVCAATAQAVLVSCIHSSPVVFETVALLVHAYRFTGRSFAVIFVVMPASGVTVFISRQI